ncbi:MAG TPA: class A beta-lactamase-related serine hydrolase [Candidatus Melainabacteria bacterium]|nr:class A beta-lactamase-related serine hydrolase [Candidatus Melainabacteria bacterium]
MRFQHLTFLCAFGLSGCVQPNLGASDSAIRQVNNPTSYFDMATLDKTIKASDFSGVTAVAENGELLFVSAYGMQNRERGIPNAVDTRFALASTSKIITAVAIMQLVERGQVALDEPVRRFFPNYPNRTVQDLVTIRHLLKMQSGLGDIFDLDYDSSTNPLANHTDYIRLFEREPLAFIPGEDFAYSNAGYILLGRIIELASGQDFYTYVTDNIFQPAGMMHTGYVDEATPGSKIALGYRAKGFDGIPERIEEIAGLSLVPNTNSISMRGTSAGGGYSTVEDFAKLDRALRTNTLISENSFSTIFGEGFARGERNAGIAGGAPGTSTRFLMRPDGRSIIVFGNKDLPSALTIASVIAEQLDQND